MNTCLICRAQAEPAFRGSVLGRHDAEYFRCRRCGYLWAKDPSWLAEAYSDAIVATDTGLAQRNITIARRLTNLLFCCLDPQGMYVDAAGGYGLLVRLMRDSGFDFYWEDKYCQNLMARGYEYSSDRGPVTAVTAIEVLEHTPDPVGFLRALMERFTTRTIIFTTVLYSGDTHPPENWWYYSFRTGQHISFFQRRTLEAIASALGVRFFSMHGLHIFTDTSLRNALIAPIVTSRLAWPLALYARYRLGSKTILDHDERMRS
jgi:hypothetical protein